MATQDPFAWQANAKCIGVPTSKFFRDEDGSDHSPVAYRDICAACPVKWECLETGIIYNFEGVWGGLTELERRKQYDEDWRQQLIEERDELGEYRKLDHIAA
jgi:hypothetical protein